MKCAICRNGKTESGTTSILLEKGQTTLIFKHVPVQVCDNCGEEYVSALVNKDLLLKAEKAVEQGIVLELLEYAA